MTNFTDIELGYYKFGGWMTPFKEKLAILDYLYNLRPKEIQQNMMQGSNNA